MLRCYMTTPCPNTDNLTDSDGDGVIDSLDICSGTPQGSYVDASGCSKQTNCLLSQLYGQDSEELKVFYDLRDNVLEKSPFGRKVMKLYYNSSQDAIEVLDEHPALKSFARVIFKASVPVFKKLAE